MTLDYGDFKFYIGETIEYCQTIEHDVKWIYAVMLKGDSGDNYDAIADWTLGRVVNKLEELDKSDDDHFLSDGDYDLLRSITDERNYLIHQIYRDFLYINNCFESEEYRRACSRMMNFHNRLKKLQNSVERVRLNAVKKYRH